MASYRRKISSASVAVKPVESGVFDCVIACLKDVDGFDQRFVLKVVFGPQTTLVVCRRSDGEPFAHGSVKCDEYNGRFFVSYGVEGWSRDNQVTARHYFRDIEDVANYLKFIVASQT